MKEVCGLGPTQVAKLKPIVDEFVQTQTLNKRKYNKDPKALDAANEKARDHYKAQVKSILTPDQISEFKADKLKTGGGSSDN
jgi:hypothetical protein